MGMSNTLAVFFWWSITPTTRSTHPIAWKMENIYFNILCTNKIKNNNKRINKQTEMNKKI